MLACIETAQGAVGARGSCNRRTRCGHGPCGAEPPASSRQGETVPVPRWARSRGRHSPWQHGRDPRLTLAPLLCSEVLGRTSEESSGSEQESERRGEQATQIPGIMSPEEGDGGLCLRREPCFYWRGLKGP